MTWRDISTAPKDGTTIIVPGGIAHWYRENWFTLTGYDYPGRPIQWTVKFWMPLPPSPQETEGE